jgi:hypothetical protein
MIAASVAVAPQATGSDRFAYDTATDLQYPPGTKKRSGIMRDAR